MEVDLDSPGLGTLDQRELYRASYINNPGTNPWLIKRWEPAEILTKAEKMPKEVFEPWFKSIIHLQKYAWRFHLKGCKDDFCLGCGDEKGIKEVELRSYFHNKQCEFICYSGPEGWMITGRRFGKTEALVFFIICRLLGYNPLTNELYKTPQRWWIIGLDYPSLRDVIIDTFKKQMPPLSAKWIGDINAWDFKRGDLLADIYNESQAIFKSNESGAAKFQGTGLNGIGIDEEIYEDVYKESRMRIKGGENLLIRGAMTPNPILGLTWTYKKILKNEEKINRGRLKVWTGSSYENKGIKKEILDEFSKEIDEWERQVRIEGNYSAGLGRCAFNCDVLLEMKEKVSEPIRTENISSGKLSVFEEPQEGFAYVIGADPAEGLEHGDNSAACIIRRPAIDAGRLAVVAVYTGAIEPDIFGKELVALGSWYNDAWIVCESNNHGLTTIKSMKDKGYINIYSNKSQEELAGIEDSRKIGWITNVATRPKLVDLLAITIRERAISIPDEATIDELITFIYDNKGKPRAQKGCKDDRVFAIGLALQGHSRCPAFIGRTKVGKEIKKIRTWWDEDELQTAENLAWMGV